MAYVTDSGVTPSKRRTLQSAVNATGNGNTLDVHGYNSIGVQIVDAGVTSFTVVFEATIDGTNWIAIQAQNKNSGAVATSATVAGLFSIDAYGIELFRARVSAITPNGQTITVTGYAEVDGAGSPSINVEATIGAVELVTENNDQVTDDTLDAVRVFEVTGETVYNATGAGAIALSTAEAGKFILVSATVHLSAAPTTGTQNLTVTLNANDGAAYDTVLRLVGTVASALTDFEYRPTEDAIYESGDQIDLAFANTDAVTYGARIVVKRVN